MRKNDTKIKTKEQPETSAADPTPDGSKDLKTAPEEDE